MDLRIFDGKADKKEKPVYLKLEEGNENIFVRAYSEKGGNLESTIACFTFAGKFMRFCNVDRTLGFILDEEGRIKLDE